MVSNGLSLSVGGLICLQSYFFVSLKCKVLTLTLNHFASVDVYTCTRQTLPDRLTVDVSHEIWCSCVWTG